MQLASVTALVAKPSDHEMALRRQALQIAVQLPSDLKDAGRVLDLVKGLLGGFMSEQRPV